MLLKTLTGAEVPVSSRWFGLFGLFRRTRITSKVSAAALIGSLWINVIEGSSSAVLTHSKAFQTHRLSPTGSGSRCVQVSRMKLCWFFHVLPALWAQLPVGIVKDDHTASRLTCQFASCCVASNGGDSLSSELHTGHVTSPQVMLGCTTARRPVSSPHSYLFKVGRDCFRLSTESIEGGRVRDKWSIFNISHDTSPPLLIELHLCWVEGVCGRTRFRLTCSGAETSYEFLNVCLKRTLWLWRSQLAEMKFYINNIFVFCLWI